GLQRVSVFLSMAQGLMVFTWVLSAMLNPVLGAVKGGLSLLISSAVLFFKGVGRYGSLINTNQLDSMTPQQLQYQCLADAIQGCR
ncbi:MAG TPA: hypothetical protein VFV38_35055, partial [Ktedonobacteraceae bacterium]|nr:hypothetical protein [Ktedonobacteraceae bacterium]